MPYELSLTYFDKDDTPHLVVTCDSAHRAFIGPFTNGLDVTLRELPSETAPIAKYRFAVKIARRKRTSCGRRLTIPDSAIST